jgi:TadE-like protein
MRTSWRSGAVSANAAAGVPARPRESGQALVEFALIAPLFLLLVVGIIQFGIGLNYWLDLNRIANQGARWGVVDKYPGCNGVVGSPGCRTLPDETLKTHLESEPVSGGLQPTAHICFEESAAGGVGQPLTVEVATRFTFLPILDLGEITLRGQATMRIEQPPAVMDAQGVDQCT